MSERRNRPLTAKFVGAVKATGKHHDGLGQGLYLRVDPGGGKFWVQRIMVRGRRREIGLGSFPTVGLADARDLAVQNKRLAREGDDPVALKRTAKLGALSFRAAARAAHEELAPSIKNPKDRAAFLSSLERHVFPRLGDEPVGAITPAQLRQTILAVREKAPEVARKLQIRMSAVFRWAIAEGHRSDNPATAEALALPKLERETRHFKALPYQEVRECLDRIKASNAHVSTKLALEFLVLTATRSGEVRGASWSEIDLEKGVWTIPAPRAKAKREHRVPLTGRAMDVLRMARVTAARSALVFPSRSEKSISDMTLSKLIKSLGYDADVHGFRTSFRTWTQEQTDYPRELCEVALSHKVGDQVERAYARSDLFEKRRVMMEEWAEFLTRCS
jgi:integrase